MDCSSGEIVSRASSLVGDMAVLGGSPLAHHIPVESVFVVTCPYCGEEVEIYLEPEIRGSLVQDCEVCCNPWLLTVRRDGEGETEVTVEPAQ